MSDGRVVLAAFIPHRIGAVAPFAEGGSLEVSAARIAAVAAPWRRAP